jgi:hypothetical protein
MAFGSPTVTVPVYVPRASDAVWNATWIGKHVPARLLHGRAAPAVATAHGADEETWSDNAPSPAFQASSVCTAPFAPTAIEYGPIVLVLSRSLGAATRLPNKLDKSAATRSEEVKTARI